jgi:CheY-like chemotaxis protein
MMISMDFNKTNPMSQTPFSVLLLDDDPHTRELFRLVFTHHDLELVTVATADAALECLRTYTPQVVVVDLVMPDIDGFEALDDSKTADQFTNALRRHNRLLFVGYDRHGLCAWIPRISAQAAGRGGAGLPVAQCRTKLNERDTPLRIVPP